MNNILDVINYMFEVIFNASESNVHLISSSEIKNRLIGAGFDTKKVDNAIYWLENIVGDRPEDTFEKITLSSNKNISRIYTDHEIAKIGLNNLKVLKFMELVDFIDMQQREHILEQCMEFNGSSLNEKDFKWVVMMSLSDEEDKYNQQWLDYVLFGDDTHIH